jgi:serine/threonine protein phosphatase 1
VGTPIVGAAHKKKNKMPVPQTFQKHLKVPANTQGRDFVVGDLHGCYDQLMTMLGAVDFNKATDRLFSVGDLVDRGPKNLECANLIYESWFYATRANHEQMMIDFLSRGKFNPNVNYQEGSSWIPNGGAWSMSEDRTTLTDLAQSLDMLPYVISVGEGKDRFNVVHAEIKHFSCQNKHEGMLYIGNFGAARVPVTDEMIDNWVFSDAEEYDMVWGREIIQNGHPTFPPPDHQLWHDLDRMSITYCGHTPLRMTALVQRQMYIDHGCVFGVKSGHSEENKLVLASPSERCVYQLTPTHNTIVQVPYSELQQLS